ncbi:MAG: hypothetical protein HY901_31240 [Deltaproteobacteria bacterium]|nr:hypothetical protein [Deltaproteobacteria bacterium]
MPAFDVLDWRRLDATAIVTFGGLATVEEPRHDATRAWLLAEGYVIDTFDCQPGLSVSVPALGRLLKWEEQFGYELAPDSRNLDALRDGFDFPVVEGGRRVLEILRPDLAWREDQRWTCGLLSIAEEHCRAQLALGARFFSILVVPEKSPFIGAVIIDQPVVPAPSWTP